MCIRDRTRTVLDPDSFEYVLDENGNRITKVAPLFGTEDFGGPVSYTHLLLSLSPHTFLNVIINFRFVSIIRVRKIYVN